MNAVKLKRKRKEKNEKKEESAHNMRFLSIQEEISTEEDIKHVVEAVVPAAVVLVVFRISIPLKVLRFTAMNKKTTKESHALNVTTMGTL